jgi:hypothetical protein
MGKKDKAMPATPAAAPAESFDMVFHVQLAHGSPTKQVRDFTNVKQLYESIAKVFGIPTETILYCTLNTHKIDMTRLLGGQIGLDDFMFAHIGETGAPLEIKVNKDGPALGLTISDNGAGFAFIKKIRDDSIMSKAGPKGGNPGIEVGDHIAKINGTDLKGCRHFEVARTLKEIPIGSEFSIAVVKPQKAFDSALKPREAMGGSGNVGAGSGKKTLRMKKDGTAVVEEIDDAVVKIVGVIDDMLDAFIGIRDIELSQSIYDYAKKADEADVFAEELDKHLSDFEFPDDFVLDVFDKVNA